MMQALQLLTVIAVGAGLAYYGLRKGRIERQQKPSDPRQQTLFQPTASSSTAERELVTR